MASPSKSASSLKEDRDWIRALAVQDFHTKTMKKKGNVNQNRSKKGKKTGPKRGKKNSITRTTAVIGTPSNTETRKKKNWLEPRTSNLSAVAGFI